LRGVIFKGERANIKLHFTDDTPYLFVFLKFKPIHQTTVVTFCIFVSPTCKLLHVTPVAPRIWCSSYDIGHLFIPELISVQVRAVRVYGKTHEFPHAYF